MLDVLQMIVSFIVAISVIIAIHEFGHYWVAKKLGVKVLRYSIGFGRPLYKHVAGQDKTEYVLAAIPLGGYVKMLDEREGEVAEKELHRAFNRQPVWKRFSIVFAGPAFNFLFAVFAFWVMLVNGVQGIKPVISDVVANSPAALAGFQKGDQILKVNNKNAPIWPVIMEEILPAVIDKGQVSVEVLTDAKRVTKRTLSFTNANINLDELDVIDASGFKLQHLKIKPVVSGIVENSPASRSLLAEGDLILKIQNQQIEDWSDIPDVIKRYANQEIIFTVQRNGSIVQVPVTPIKTIDKGKEYIRIGIQRPAIVIPEELKTEYRYSMLDAVRKSIQSTINFTALTFKFLGKLVTLDISIKNLSSPIGIAKYAGISAEAGLSYFFMFLAQISISIGILNLLPIPLLDGGHLFFYIIEFIRGKPVSESAEYFGQRIGLALLLTLMSVAVYNDLIRLFD